MKNFTIKSKVKNFTVFFEDDFKFIDKIKNLNHYMIITDENVYELYREKIFKLFPHDKIIILPLDESTKTMESVLSIYKKLLNKVAKKNMTIISFGGGINQDVVGFAVSTLYRGINWIYVPTTLLAMADSAIGLKTSLNFDNYKNVLGTFYPPNEIFINVDFLDSLKQTDYASGIGEIIKLLLMDDNSINNLDLIIKNSQTLRNRKNKKEIIEIIGNAMKIKLSYMEGDEFDLGRRNLLNYGHEFGHALEPASDYAVPHGIAVMIGIIFANFISLKRGHLNKKNYEEINRKLLLPNIKFTGIKLEKKFFDKDSILHNMKKDKKRISEGLVLVLPIKDLSLLKINDLSIDELHEGIIELVKFLKT